MSQVFIQTIESTGGPRYLRSFYLRFHAYAIEKWPFSGTYPLIYSYPWSFYIRIHYMRANFWSPCLSHITRSVLSILANLNDRLIVGSSSFVSKNTDPFQSGKRDPK